LSGVKIKTCAAPLPRVLFSFFLTKYPSEYYRNFFKRLLEKRVMKFFLCVMGMVMIVEGLPYFAFPEKMKHWIYKILESPEGSLRKFGFILMASGLVLIYMGKN
jgi:uncharacterized protein